jgi:cell wall-associated NlpC family hydrolase
VTRAEVVAAAVAEARSWIDTPFAPNGQQKGLAVDCGHLLVAVAHALGLPHIQPERQQPGLYDPAKLFAALEQDCERLPEGSPMEPGDVLVFSIRGEPIHSGICTGPLTMVHAWDTFSVQRVVEMPLDSWWQRQLHSIWRSRYLPAE